LSDEGLSNGAEEGELAAASRARKAARLALSLLVVFVLPLLVSACVYGRDSSVPWYEARRDATGLAPDPAKTPDAVIQVYAARAVSWRGIFAVHTWIVVKPTDAPKFTRYEVVGFSVSESNPAIKIDRTGPDNYWFGAKPELILDRRGPGVDAMIAKVRESVRAYPYPNEYRAWPGPNSNTFTAWIARQVPELGLAIPSNAIGKDYLPGGAVFAAAPSATGYQFSLFGVLGLLVARDEGIEINLLGMDLGIGFKMPGVKLPGVGLVAWPEAAGSAA
jgi:hypothetical protein